MPRELTKALGLPWFWWQEWGRGHALAVSSARVWPQGRHTPRQEGSGLPGFSILLARSRGGGEKAVARTWVPAPSWEPWTPGWPGSAPGIGGESLDELPLPASSMPLKING